MKERPVYRELVPGQKHFACEPLRATLSTQACSLRWQAAAPGSACHKCGIGHLHAADHAPSKRAGRRPSDRQITACLRCGRSDLRIVKAGGVCVSCANRVYEWFKGKNAKGKPPERFKPLHSVEVPVQLQDGRVERRILEARDEAEAIARVLLDLPEGARLLTNERRHTVWNEQTGEFELVCQHCGVAGLVVERLRAGKLERWNWCCAGSDPIGAGWQPATVRAPLLAMRVDAAAAALDADPEIAGEAPYAWTPTPWVCVCGTGQVEALLTEPNGRWKTRCRACGASSHQTQQFVKN